MRKLDLIHHTFGRLTVIDIAEKVGKKTAWLCQCECGNQKVIVTESLRSGRTQSCGCLKDEMTSERLTKDLTNHIFGRLTVLYKDNTLIPKERNYRSKWWCKCECGNIISVIGHDLRSGATKSCGCLRDEIRQNRIIDITNQIFGKLRVLYRDLSKEKTYWICECQCGNLVSVSYSNLIYNHQQSCGCMNISKGEEYIRTILNNYNINFHFQKTFDKCVSPQNYLLKFDFFLPDYNTAIEYHGKQHFEFSSYFHKTVKCFNYRCECDKIKIDYCINNDIDIIICTYQDKREDIQSKILSIIEFDK